MRSGIEGAERVSDRPDDAPILGPDELRQVLGGFATGVTIVAARDPESGALCGLTANSFTSVSLEPPLVLVCIDEGSDTLECIERADHFSVSILTAEQVALSRRFAGSDSSGKFEGVAHRVEATGAPIIDGALAWVDCRVWARYPGGDHTIFVGEVVAGGLEGGEPLVFFRGEYAKLAP